MQDKSDDNHLFPQTEPLSFARVSQDAIADSYQSDNDGYLKASGLRPFPYLTQSFQLFSDKRKIPLRLSNDDPFYKTDRIGLYPP